MLPLETIRQLAQGSDDEYLFDFGLIPGAQYQALFRTFQRFGW
jgi:hypothetical protein